MKPPPADQSWIVMDDAPGQAQDRGLLRLAGLWLGVGWWALLMGPWWLGLFALALAGVLAIGGW